MKVLTKYFKVALCFMAFALCSFMFAFTPTLTAVQAAEMAMTGYNVAINAIKMPTEEVNYENGDRFKVPFLNSSMGVTTPSNYTIRVIDPAGHQHNYVVGGTSEQNDATYFSPDGNNLVVNAKNDGEYKIIYIVEENGRKYYSNSYKVTVKGVSYELDFSTPVWNSTSNKLEGFKKNLFSSKIAVGTELVIPTVYAKQAETELNVDNSGNVTNPVANVKVTKETESSQEAVVLTDSDFTTNANGEKTVTPTETGIYTIEYSYTNSANRPTKTFTVEVVSQKEYEDAVTNLKLASTPTMPKIELGKKDITLPKLTVNSEVAKNVDVNIESIVIEKENDSTIKCVLNNNNVKFDMTPSAFNADNYEDMVGNYRITYTVKDAYGKTLIETFKVDGVTISSKPSISLSYNYDKTAANFQDNVKLGAEVELKAEYTSDKEILLPAVFVEDAVTTNYSDFKVVRAIRKGSTYYYLDNKKYDESTKQLVDVPSTDKGYNHAIDSNIGNIGKAVKFKFADDAENIEGTYYLEYRVISNQVKERENNLYVEGTNEKFTFKVVSSHTATTPTIEITNLKNISVKNTEKVSVKVSAHDESDKRLKKAVFTYSSKKSTATESLDFYISKASDDAKNTNGYEQTSHIFENELFLTEMNKYFNDFAIVVEDETKDSFTLDLTEKSGEVNVVAATLNDDGKFATDSRIITIKDTTDSTAPVLTILNADTIWKDGSNIKEFKVGQGVEVKLPEIYVKDADKTANVNVMYYVGKPENSYGGITYKSPIGKKFSYQVIGGEEVQVIDGGTITTSQIGIYYVAYSATDVAGNTSVMYFTFEVEDTSKPILSVDPVGDNLTITGNTVEAKKGTIIDFDVTLRSADGQNDYTSNENITIEIDDNGKGLDYQLSGNGRTSYVFNDYGTYVVTISGKHNDIDADNKVIKINITKQEIKWLGEFDIPEYASKGETIKLPDIAANNGAVVKVTYVAPSSSESEAKDATKKTDSNGYSYWEFTTSATAKGTYTVIYTATTDEDTLVQKKSIKVGDNVAPTLSFNKGDLTQELIYDGEHDIEYVVEIDRSKKTFVVKAINNGKEIYSHNIGLTISDNDDTTEVSSNMSWSKDRFSFELTGDHVTKGESTDSSTQYFITGTGKYALKLTAKDGYDNSRTETIEFKVVSKSEVKENKDTVIGAVLIVISLVLLAGVILFFTFTGKKGGAKKEKTNKTKTVKETKTIESEKVEEKVEAQPEEVVEEKVDEEPKSGDVE